MYGHVSVMNLFALSKPLRTDKLERLFPASFSSLGRRAMSLTPFRAQVQTMHKIFTRAQC
jgi:hypothetical protein